jgi:predicted neuraminidase
MFSPRDDCLDFGRRVGWGRVCRGPLDPGPWALLPPAGPQNHAPQLCWLDDERLGCVWMAGGLEGTAGMAIHLSVLRRCRGRWSRPVRISQDPERSEQNPLLFRTDDGSLQLIHTAQRSRNPEDPDLAEGSSFSMQWTAALRTQWRRPGSRRWSRAEDLLPPPAFCRHPPVRRADGLWLLPIYRSLEAGGAFGHDHSLVQVLDAEGRAHGDPVPVPESTGRVHGSIVPTADGLRLLQFFRSRLADRIYVSEAGPDGGDWSVPRPIDLPNNNSSIQALRLASGRLAMIYNRFCFEPDPLCPQSWGEANWPRTRWPLAIALSPDEGESWPWIRDIDTGLGFCGTANWHLNGQLAYPSILEGPPGELHIAYSWGGRQAIRHLCLREDDILGLQGDLA